ncbi:LptA/OstA family protein [Maricaulis sp. CAU 1757]
MMLRFLSTAGPLAALFAIISLSSAPASAQIGDSTLPIDIRADHFDAFNSERRVIYTGSEEFGPVRIFQGTSSLEADRVEIFFNGAGSTTGTGPAGSWGNVERIVATGHVLYVTPEQRARGDRGEYEMESETITLTGDVVITQGENVITGSRFVTNLVTGNSTFGSSGDGERVRSVIMPRSAEATDEQGSDEDAQPSNR